MLLGRLLVALDGSLDGQAAVELGIRWARRYGAALAGLGVVDSPEILRSEVLPPGGTAFKQRRDEVLMADARAKVRGFLDHFARDCTAAGIAAEAIEEDGDPYDRIVRQAQRADLILLGLRSNFHFQTREHDETLLQVIRDSPRPVVAVPAVEPIGDSVLVAYDGSLQASRALATFQATGLGRDRTISLLCADTDPEVSCDHLGLARDYLQAHGLEPREVTSSTPSSPSQAILDAVLDLGAGLVVMGAYGKPRLREFFLGSVTRTMLKQSPVPLFLSH